MQGPVFGTKVAQLIQGPLNVKGGGVQFDCRMGRIDTGASTGSFLGFRHVRSRVGAQKEFWAAGSRRLNECLSMFFGFENWQTVEVGADTANKHIC